jgi:hypothetical protein
MIMRILILPLFCLFMPLPLQAQEGRQIRLDANTCKNIMPEYIRKANNPLYAKALAAKKAGKANDMQIARISEIEFLHYTVKVAKCKGVK